MARAAPQTETISVGFGKVLLSQMIYGDGLPRVLYRMSALVDTNALDSVNPSLTRYGRKDPAPVLPLREEPDLLSWLEASGRLVADEESDSTEVSTVEEEELSALMGEKEDYNKDDEQNEEQWED